jgi:NitT/TauT family transport system substrate-binding protein
MRSVISGVLGALLVAALLTSLWTAPSTAAAPAGALATTAADAASAPTAAQSPTHLRFASQPVATNVALYLASDRGYFQQEGIDLEYVPFTDSSQMIPALATDQVELAGISANPATWNAVARGVTMKLVLDKGSFLPGRGNEALVVRKDLYDAGRGRQLEDFRGLTLAVTPPGLATTAACAMSRGFQQRGISMDQLTIQPLPFPDMVPAFANGAIESADMAEPFLTRALQQGTVVRVIGLDELYPNFTVSVVGFSTSLYANRPVARGFVRAYIRAIRDYNAALARPPGDPDRTLLGEVIARRTGLDAATVQDMVPPGLDPNGLPNQESQVYCYQFFRDQGLITQPVSEAAMAALWGTELVDEVLSEIGRLPPS